jgi:hypothetical protein
MTLFPSEAGLSGLIKKGGDAVPTARPEEFDGDFIFFPDKPEK